jgi:TRAP-type C4-dicarboxylate transport system permease small subunit
MIDQFIRRIDKIMTAVETLCIGVLSVVALIIGVMQVVLRYVFNTGFEWNEAIFILLTIWAMLIAGSYGIKKGAHVSVDIVPQLVSPPARRVLSFLANLAALGLTGYFLYCGWLYVEFTKMMDTASPDTGIKDWVVHLIVPITMAAFCLRYLILLVSNFRNIEDSSEEVPDNDFSCDQKEGIG